MFTNNNQLLDQQHRSSLSSWSLSSLPSSSSCCNNNNNNNNNTTTASSLFCNTNAPSSLIGQLQEQQEQQEQEQQQQNNNNHRVRKRMKTTDDNNNDDVDIVVDITRELYELSVEERERAYEDIHGIPSSIEGIETPEFITQKLQEMNDALDTNRNKFTFKQLRPYQKAIFLWPKLKYDAKEFKLLFLRTDNFDAMKAASRLVHYYIEKRLLFGDEKLVKKITIDDLTENEVGVLSSGYLTEINTTDRSGRPLFYSNLSKYDPQTMTIDNVIRATWYIFMVLITETEGGRTKGVCAVCQTPSDTNFSGVTQLGIRFGYLYGHCWPGRITAMHQCYNTPDIGFWVMNHLSKFIGHYSRMRLRGHIGSDIENEYELLSYGIRLDGLLQKNTNDDASEMFNGYVTRRKEIERKYYQQSQEEAIRTGYVEYPYPSDSIIGRGRPYRDWVGSKLFNGLVEKHVDSYLKNAETNCDKLLIAYDVIDDYMESPQSRFILEPITTTTTSSSSSSSSSSDKNNSDPSTSSSTLSSSHQQQLQHYQYGWKILNMDVAKEKAFAAVTNRVKQIRLSTKRRNAVAAASAAVVRNQGC